VQEDRRAREEDWAKKKREERLQEIQKLKDAGIL
jgi:hypothetical protein